MPDPVVTASAISAGASILSGAFGGGGYSRSDESRTFRRQRSHESWQQNQRSLERAHINANDYKQKVAGAKAAGLHPLFAMGAQTSGMGSSPSFNIQGQSPKGNFAKDGLQAVASHYGRMADFEAQKSLIDAQNTAAALNLLGNNLGNDRFSGSPHDNSEEINRNPIVTAPQAKRLQKDNLVEYKPSVQQSHDPHDKSRSNTYFSAKKKMFISNDHWLYVPNVEDMGDLMDGGAIMLASIVAMNTPRAIDQLLETNSALSKKMAAYLKTLNTKKPRSRYAGGQFYPYSRGPHR